MAFPLRVSAVRALVNEISASGEKGKPLVVGGARELAPVLRRELGRGATLVRGDDSPEGGAVLVYILAHEVREEDEAALKRARRGRVPIVAVVTGRLADDLSIPYVLATDLVRVRAGEGFPVETITRVIAGRLGEDAAPLAAGVPVLRRAVADELVSTFARKNGITGAAVFFGGADLPVLAMNQLRLLIRLEQAYGRNLDLQERLPEIAATVGAAFGWRALSREIVRLVPIPRWAVKGGVAYAGTRALGEAAINRLEVMRPGGHATPRPGAASPAGP
jgi:uncharacterized protein (DUF697 family)